MVAEFDVIIAGTGPAGLALANILGRNKVRTLVLERDPGLSTHPKALNLDDEFFRLLHSLGLGPSLKAHAKYPISYDYVSPLGLRLGFIEGRVTEHNFPNRAAIFQPEFEQMLCRHAEESGYVRVEFDRELSAFHELEAGIEVEASQADGGKHRYRARYLVGADGAHSACRKQLGLNFTQVDPFDVRHVVIDVLDDIDPSPLALTKMGWRRNFFSMPAPNGRRFEFSLQKHESPEDLLDDNVLRRLFKPWRNYDELKIIRKVVHTFRSRIVPKFSIGRVFLIGDAAHLMPIFGSQGMNSGARDANNLGWKLVRVIRDGAPASLLETYHGERWNAVLETIKMATTNGKVQRVKSIPMSLARDLFFGAMRLIPSASKYIREMKYIPKPFLRSPLIAPGTETGRKMELVGRLNPNPTVLCNGKEQLLDDITGYGFALIGLGVDAADVAALTAGAQALGPSLVILQKGNAHGTTQTQKQARAGGTTVATVLDNRYDDVFAQYDGKWLLVRPDRIVACAASQKDLIAQIAPLMTMLSAADDGARAADMMGENTTRRRAA